VLNPKSCECVCCTALVVKQTLFRDKTCAKEHHTSSWCFLRHRTTILPKTSAVVVVVFSHFKSGNYSATNRASSFSFHLDQSLVCESSKFVVSKEITSALCVCVCICCCHTNNLRVSSIFSAPLSAATENKKKKKKNHQKETTTVWGFSVMEKVTRTGFARGPSS
jgi:hypothetical protein